MGEKVTYRSNGGTSEGYLAVPADGGPAPAVIVIQEWWGLVPHITGGRGPVRRRTASSPSRPISSTAGRPASPTRPAGC